jgi:uridine kinase
MNFFQQEKSLHDQEAAAERLIPFWDAISAQAAATGGGSIEREWLEGANGVSEVGGRIEAALRGASAQIGTTLRAAPARAGRTRVVAIDGRSGSGKTRLAGLLRAELGAPVVSLEDLYGGWDGLERGIDLLVTEVFEPLAARRRAHIPRYDWITRTWGESASLDPPELLIVEGVGAGARRAAISESLLVWLEAPADVRKKRALDRDGETFAPYWDYWAAQEDAMLAREHTPERADILIDAG